MTPDQGQRFMFDGHPVRGQMACIETTLAEVFGPIFVARKIILRT